MSNPPTGGREVNIAKSYEDEKRNYWSAIDSAEYKTAIAHIQEISDANLPNLWKKLGLTARVG